MCHCTSAWNSSQNIAAFWTMLLALLGPAGLQCQQTQMLSNTFLQEELFSWEKVPYMAFHKPAAHSYLLALTFAIDSKKRKKKSYNCSSATWREIMTLLKSLSSLSSICLLESAVFSRTSLVQAAVGGAPGGPRGPVALFISTCAAAVHPPASCCWVGAHQGGLI